mmetsp:Transcript_54179/g.144791  ORF Transcript_54179/g.144791 Transcript_54179/m.144791 type:complete len:81 (-) Transcript_54179:15-257(-)
MQRHCVMNTWGGSLVINAREMGQTLNITCPGDAPRAIQRNHGHRVLCLSLIGLSRTNLMKFIFFASLCEAQPMMQLPAVH